MSINFSWAPLVIILLPMFPNLIYFVLPHTDIPASTGTGSQLIGILENFSRAITFFLLLFFSNSPEAGFQNPWNIPMLVFLLLYFVLWGQYYSGGGSYSLLSRNFLGIPMPMAIFPVCYFICAGVLLDSLPALIAFVFFGFFHIISNKD